MLLKVTLLCGCFSRFQLYVFSFFDSTKSRKTSHLICINLQFVFTNRINSLVTHVYLVSALMRNEYAFPMEQLEGIAPL